MVMSISFRTFFQLMLNYLINTNIVIGLDVIKYFILKIIWFLSKLVNTFYATLGFFKIP
jgi:hypothetical protein